jgi:hypothetical protein
MAFKMNRRYKLTQLLRTRNIYIELLNNCPLCSQIIIRESLTAIEQSLCIYIQDEELICVPGDFKLENLKGRVILTNTLNN